ncbi:IS91 family transposase, partial [Ornithinibacillus halotolerans]|uniref:IS91 family transposase n=1 Tax=Ornithinibacillus halotolerans TaxID=1274357 RepID=UPI0016662EB0
MSTIQQIFKKYYPSFIDIYNPSAQQAKAANSIIQCRTQELGGQSYSCEDCGHTVMRHHSCRNRHCPSCQGVNKEVWVDQRKKDILNAPYFHVVFTMPRQLHG